MPLGHLFTECAVRYFTFSPMLSGDDNIGIIEGRCISELDNNNPSSHMGCDAHHDGTQVIPVESKILAADGQNKSFGGRGGNQNDGKDRMMDCNFRGQQEMKMERRTWWPGLSCLPKTSEGLPKYEDSNLHPGRRTGEVRQFDLDGVAYNYRWDMASSSGALGWVQQGLAARAVAAAGVREVVQMVDGVATMDMMVDNGAPGTILGAKFTFVGSDLPVNTTRTVGWMNDMGVARNSQTLQKCKFFPSGPDDWRRSGTLITKMHNGRPLFNLTHGTFDAQRGQPYYYTNVQWAEKPDIILEMAQHNQQALFTRANHVRTSNVGGSSANRINNLNVQQVAEIILHEAQIAHNNMNEVNPSMYSYESHNDSADKQIAQGRKHFMRLDPVLGILYVTGKHNGDIGQALMGLLAFITGNKLWLITHDRWLFNWLCNCEILTKELQWRSVPLRGLCLNCHAGGGENMFVGFKLTGPPVLGGDNATRIIQLKTRETDKNIEISALQELLGELRDGRPLQTTRTVLTYCRGENLEALPFSFDTPPRDLLENARRLCETGGYGRCTNLDDTNTNQWMKTLESIDFPTRIGTYRTPLLQLGLVGNNTIIASTGTMIVKMLLQWLKDLEPDHTTLERLGSFCQDNEEIVGWVTGVSSKMKELRSFLLVTILQILNSPNLEKHNISRYNQRLCLSLSNVMESLGRDHRVVLDALKRNIAENLSTLEGERVIIQSELGNLSSNSCSTTTGDKVWEHAYLPMWKALILDILGSEITVVERDALRFFFDSHYASSENMLRWLWEEGVMTFYQENSGGTPEQRVDQVREMRLHLQKLIQTHTSIKERDEISKSWTMRTTQEWQEQLDVGDLNSDNNDLPPDFLVVDDLYLQEDEQHRQQQYHQQQRVLQEQTRQRARQHHPEPTATPPPLPKQLKRTHDQIGPVARPPHNKQKPKRNSPPKAPDDDPAFQQARARAITASNNDNDVLAVAAVLNPPTQASSDSSEYDYSSSDTNDSAELDDPDANDSSEFSDSDLGGGGGGGGGGGIKKKTKMNKKRRRKKKTRRKNKKKRRKKTNLRRKKKKKTIRKRRKRKKKTIRKRRKRGRKTRHK